MRFSFLLLLALSLMGCQEDLMPSGKDKRPSVVPGSIGHLPTQKVADFTLPSTSGGNLSLSQLVNLDGSNATPVDAVVIYFTMWCSTCDTHTYSISSTVMPAYAGVKNVRYLLIDYVSGSVSAVPAFDAATYGYDLLVDTDNAVKQQLDGSMGTTVIIDSQGIIHMNQTYNVNKVLEILDGI